MAITGTLAAVSVPTARAAFGRGDPNAGASRSPKPGALAHAPPASDAATFDLFRRRDSPFSRATVNLPERIAARPFELAGASLPGDQGPAAIRCCISSADVYLDGVPYNGHFSMAVAVSARVLSFRLNGVPPHTPISRKILASLDLDSLPLASYVVDYIRRPVEVGTNVARMAALRAGNDRCFTRVYRGAGDWHYATFCAGGQGDAAPPNERST